jgi:hypothetical protein
MASTPLLVGIENPLLDIMTEVDPAFLERYTHLPCPPPDIETQPQARSGA